MFNWSTCSKSVEMQLWMKGHLVFCYRQSGVFLKFSVERHTVCFYHEIIINFILQKYKIATVDMKFFPSEKLYNYIFHSNFDLICGLRPRKDHIGDLKQRVGRERCIDGNIYIIH